MCAEDDSREERNHQKLIVFDRHLDDGSLDVRDVKGQNQDCKHHPNDYSIFAILIRESHRERERRSESKQAGDMNKQ